MKTEGLSYSMSDKAMAERDARAAEAEAAAEWAQAEGDKARAKARADEARAKAQPCDICGVRRGEHEEEGIEAMDHEFADANAEREEADPVMEEASEAASELEEIKVQIMEALDAAQELLRRDNPAIRSERRAAESYWISHIKTALDDDHEYCGGSMLTMQDTIDALTDKVVAER